MNVFSNRNIEAGAKTFAPYESVVSMTWRAVHISCIRCSDLNYLGKVILLKRILILSLCQKIVSCHHAFH